MSLRPVDLAPGADDVVRHLGDLEHVLVGLGREAAHEIQLDLTPALPVSRRDGADQVVLADHLVDHPAEPFAAALGREGQTGAATIAGELVGQIDVEGVHSGRRKGQGHLLALVAVGQTLGDLADLGMVRAGKREQSDLFEPGCRETVSDHLADAGDAPFPHRAGDHAGLAEPAAPRASAKDLDAHPLVHRLGHRHERGLRVGPGVEVHDRVLGHPRGNPLPIRHNLGQPTVRVVTHVVEARHIDAADRREPGQQSRPARLRRASHHGRFP